MWQKDDYQEQMLGYLDEVEAAIKQIAHARLRQYDVNQLYADFDTTVQRLWRLIAASDIDWEGFRYPLETSCDQLQRAFYRTPPADALVVSASRAVRVKRTRKAERRESVELLG